MSEVILNLGAERGNGFDEKGPGFVSKANLIPSRVGTDPVVSPTATTPADFAAQFPQPLDTTELVTMCEEISAWKNLPEKRTSLKEELWRELNELAFSSGSSWISFQDGYCPEEYYHDGDNRYVDLKNIGAHKSLTISDIMHSAAVSAMSNGPYGVGISRLVGGFQFGEGMPGGNEQGSFLAEHIADLKAKEMVLAGTLVLNGWDKLLINGNATTNPLEFDGLETIITASAGAHASLAADASGTFSAASFDRFLSEGCAKPTQVWGHPQAIQEMMSAYFVLGFQGSQIIYNDSGNRMVPGFNFAGEVNTAIGTLKVVADRNFTVTASGASSFQSNLYALRMVHNGEPLVYKITQIPLAFRDLVPGCTSIQFMIWAKTALVVKALCAHGVYTALFNGRSIATCPQI